MKSELERADPAALAAFDPRTKACTMNCGPSFDDPRSPEERRLLCPDCETVKVPRQQDFDWADKQLPAGITRQDVCIWTQDSDGPWNTSCGVTWEYNDGGPAENKAHFCHHCGGVLLADPFADDDAQPNKGNDWPPLKDAPVPECATQDAILNEWNTGGSTTAQFTPAAPTPAALSAAQVAFNALDSVDDLLRQRGVHEDASVRHQLSIARSIFKDILASLQPPAQGNAELVRAIERLRKEWQRAADCSDFPDLDNQDFLDVIEAATALSRQPSQQGPSEEEVKNAKRALQDGCCGRTAECQAGCNKGPTLGEQFTLQRKNAETVLRWAEQSGRAG